MAKLPNFARKDSIFIYPGDLVADPAGKFAGAGPRDEPDPAGGGLVAVAGVDLLLRALDVRLARAPLVPVSSGLLSWGAPDSTERGVIFWGQPTYLACLDPLFEMDRGRQSKEPTDFHGLGIPNLK